MDLIAHLLAALGALLAPAAAPGQAVAQRPVHVVSPRPYEVWDGEVRGVARCGRQAVSVRAGGRRWRVAVAPDCTYAGRVAPVPRGDVAVTVGGRRVEPVRGIPPGSLAALRPPEHDARLARRLRALAAGAGPIVGAYIERADGSAATWNAGARFEAASTLKLAVMLTALARRAGPLERSPLWDPFVAIATWSDNAAANQVLVAIGGDEAAGAARMTAFVRSLGLRDTFMGGGYVSGIGGGPPPVTAVEPPPTPDKTTTPADMAALARLLVGAAVGEGRLADRGVSPNEARQLLYLLLGAQDEGLVRAGAGGLPVAHKIGLLSAARHDVAIVFTPRGPLVAAVFSEGLIDGSEARFAAAAVRSALRMAPASRRKEGGRP